MFCYRCCYDFSWTSEFHDPLMFPAMTRTPKAQVPKQDSPQLCWTVVDYETNLPQDVFVKSRTSSKPAFEDLISTARVRLSSKTGTAVFVSAATAPSPSLLPEAFCDSCLNLGGTLLRLTVEITGIASVSF